MSNITTMAQRELGAYVFSPIAYVATAVFLCAAGLAFGLGVFEPGGEASLRKLLDPWVILILVLVVPLLAMRLMSEEYRSGTVETLLTVPITEAEVILGKFLGAFAFCLAMLATMLIYPIILAMYGYINKLATSKDWTLREIRQEGATLEDFFVQVTAKQRNQ